MTGAVAHSSQVIRISFGEENPEVPSDETHSLNKRAEYSSILAINKLIKQIKER